MMGKGGGLECYLAYCIFSNKCWNRLVVLEFWTTLFKSVWRASSSTAGLASERHLLSLIVLIFVAHSFSAHHHFLALSNVPSLCGSCKWLSREVGWLYNPKCPQGPQASHFWISLLIQWKERRRAKLGRRLWLVAEMGAFVAYKCLLVSAWPFTVLRLGGSSGDIDAWDWNIQGSITT